MNHTSGNWNYSKTINDFEIYTGDSPSGLALVYRGSRNIPDEEAEANVRIMTAAPELLAACERAENYLFTKYPKEADIFNELRAAIVKAKY